MTSWLTPSPSTRRVTDAMRSPPSSRAEAREHLGHAAERVRGGHGGLPVGVARQPGQAVVSIDGDGCGHPLDGRTPLLLDPVAQRRRPARRERPRSYAAWWPWSPMPARAGRFGRRFGSAGSVRVVVLRGSRRRPVRVSTGCVPLAEEAGPGELDLGEVDLGVAGQGVVDDVGEVDGEVGHARVQLLADEACAQQQRVHPDHGAALAVLHLLLRLDPAQVEAVAGVEVDGPLEDEE